ncbi:universal stress protein [Chryseolinea lacunae]|uniref:Universal stress protein n=1 Tax=Chryseolinea lacunae TaxID=2801331 RepID=A0ABS1KV03_9BACT|nr:universal stress protein [Chryseolinea lacunae]MBL0743023.1 universal stress protein [Chryseolinea lacunae]
MKKILVPCDFSQPARNALLVATEIAAKSKGEIIVLHVIYLPALTDPYYGSTPISYSSGLISQMEADAQAGFERLTQNMPAGIPVKLQIEMGSVLETIKQTIHDQSIDLVVMGTSGSSGLAEMLVGSVTEKVVRHSPVPVLCVPKAVALASLKNILVPTALLLNESDFIKKLKALQNFVGATLHILYVNTPAHFRRDAEIKEALAEFIKNYHLENCKTYIKNHYTEEEGIIDFAEREKMDLVAMATHARKGLSHVFNTSITEDVVNHIAYPVWTYTLKPQA